MLWCFQVSRQNINESKSYAPGTEKRGKVISGFESFRDEAKCRCTRFLLSLKKDNNSGDVFSPGSKSVHNVRPGQELPSSFYQRQCKATSGNVMGSK